MIVLFSDFGLTGPYTGQVKARLLQEAPDVQIIDLFADAPSQNPKAASYLLAAYANEFPEGTIFLCVVDPGVGGDRLPLIVKASNKWFVGPGNGLFEGVLRAGSESAEVWEVTWRPKILSNSFHGRDLFAPVAGMLHCGNEPPGVPRPLDWNRYNGWPDPLLEIIYIDNYGNAMTGISGYSAKKKFDIKVNNCSVGYANTFSDVSIGQPFWYVNSNGLVEIAVNQGSAAELFSLVVGSSINIGKNRES
ncbi:MAG TPA: hypothetical protein EYO73_00350 [Sulfurimonas sp.]|nr:hypothetical protein [Sulfurimonas sp.]